MVRLTSTTISTKSSTKTLDMKLMDIKVMVGMKTVRMLLTIGLPRLISTTMPSVLPIMELHIWMLLMVYRFREISRLKSSLTGYNSVKSVPFTNSIRQT